MEPYQEQKYKYVINVQRRSFNRCQCYKTPFYNFVNTGPVKMSIVVSAVTKINTYSMLLIVFGIFKNVDVRYVEYSYNCDYK